MGRKDNGSFKPKKIYFSQVSNHALRDNRLSLKAKGLYSLIQSYITIENFILYKNTLKKVCSEGNTAFESGWKELKDKGYLVQEKHQAGDGTFYYLYDLLDKPVHTPETRGVDNLPYGKPGAYSNTYQNNTDLNNTKSNNEKGQDLTPCPDYAEKISRYVIGQYLEQYKTAMDKDHPVLRRGQWERVAEEIAAFDGEYSPDWGAMIDRHFERGMDTDYNINHFATAGVLTNILYEIGL